MWFERTTLFRKVQVLAFLWVLMVARFNTSTAHADDVLGRQAKLLARFCSDCHADKSPAAGLNLRKLASKPDMAKNFRAWRKVAAMLEQNKMPPADADQLSADQRRKLVTTIRGGLERVAREFSDDPGPVTIRRLTSSEYAYTVRDLTGLELDVQRDFVSDAVGGEGFTNVGGAQFMQDSTLERYLSAAKRVAEHAIVGGAITVS